ncbi:substrate-binding domain-containing protein [uncultured Weissella sp.]|uniref:substrate-binding domain-containing protein n=1 Tax=uncultured Weissella sp. TaxID=253243 RepID=UPI0025825541|nr:substrate-binding domain-containing protein [uncultured Weissella sp.]
MVTMRDVAKVAGVSLGVVSRIVNQDPTLRVTDKTKKHVEKIVKELGYIPSKHAGHQVAVIMAFDEKRIITDPYFSELLNQLHYFCQKSTLRVSMTLWAANKLDLNCLKGYKGVIVIGPFTTSSITSIKKIVNCVVVIDDNTNIAQIDQIKSNFNLITIRILNDFKVVGRKRITFVGGDIEKINSSGKSWNNLVDVRLETYSQWMHKHALSPDIVNVGLTVEDGRKAGKYLINRRRYDEYNFPNAIIALNDLIARGIIDIFSENNIEVPNDVCVVGFDNLPITELKHPTITSVKIPIDDVANAAVRLLRDQINQTLTGVNIVTVPSKIVSRESFKKIN